MGSASPVERLARVAAQSSAVAPPRGRLFLDCAPFEFREQTRARARAVNGLRLSPCLPPSHTRLESACRRSRPRFAPRAMDAPLSMDTPCAMESPRAATNPPRDCAESLLRAHHAAASPVLRYSAVAPVRIDGWLGKEGKALRARRPRFMRLQGHVLTSHRAKGAPASWHVSVAHALVEKGPRPREFKLALPHRSLTFVAPSDRAFDTWVVALRRASLVSSRVEDFYRIGRLVGEGMNGQVRLAHDLLTEHQVAVKMVPRLGRENETQFLAREVQIILSVSHPNIVRTIDVFVRSRRIHFVMEYLAGGELFDFIAENTLFTEGHASTVMADLLAALSYLHARGIAHRDVKLENLLCANTSWPLNVKLADFGFSNFVGEGEPTLSSFVGTPYYIAPEMLRGSNHGRPVDIWASGVVLYILLSGKFPFGGKNESEYYQRVLSKEAYFPSDEWDNVSEDAKDLVRGMLCKDPAKRLTAEQCLQHPWLKNAEALIDQQLDVEVFPLDTPETHETYAPPIPRSPMERVSAVETGILEVDESATKESVTAAASPDDGVSADPHVPRRGAVAVTETKISLAKAKRPVLPSPGAFRDNREKRGRWRYLGMLNHSLTGPTDVALATRHAGEKKPEKRQAHVDRSSNRASVAFDEAIMETVEDPTVNRRPSLIRRLLSSGKLSLDRYDGRFPSFRGTVDDPTDEAAAQPRKTLSLFAKDGPLRRSFHRVGERVGENRASHDGINFVNSQSQRLPPKVARERQRQQRQAEALRKAPRGGGIFSQRRANGHQFSSQPSEYHSSPRLQIPLVHPFSSVPTPPGQRASNATQNRMGSHSTRRRFSASGSHDQDRFRLRQPNGPGPDPTSMLTGAQPPSTDEGFVRRTVSAEVSSADRLAHVELTGADAQAGRRPRGR